MTDSPRLGYTVRDYQPGDEDGIIKLFNVVFGEGNSEFTPRNLDDWRWEYAKNPAGIQVIVAVDDHNRVIAHYGGLPARYQCGDRKIICGQGVDSMVHPEWRRGLKKEGPFLAVAKRYFATYGTPEVNPFTFGYPNRRAIRIGQRLLGYVPVVEQMPTLHRNFFAHETDQDVADQLDDRLVVRPIDRFEENVNPLWESQCQSMGLAIIRDREYLNWRYVDCSLAQYECFGVYDHDGLRGWFVTQKHWQQLPIFALVDFLARPDDALVLRHALHTAVQHARRTQHARVEAWFPPDSPQFQNTLSMGFETEPCQYVLCIRIHDPALELDWVKSNWYYTIGDSDIL